MKQSYPNKLCLEEIVYEICYSNYIPHTRKKKTMSSSFARIVAKEKRSKYASRRVPPFP